MLGRRRRTVLIASATVLTVGIAATIAGSGWQIVAPGPDANIGAGLLFLAGLGTASVGLVGLVSVVISGAIALKLRARRRSHDRLAVPPRRVDDHSA